MFQPRDNLMTPEDVWQDIAAYIPSGAVVSMPFYGDGLSQYRLGQYIDNTILHTNENFFQYDRGDIVVDNCPISQRMKVLTTLKRRDKPFILLTSAGTLCYKYFSRLFKDDNIQLIIPNRRYKMMKWDFDTNTIPENWKKISPQYEYIWICYKMNFEKDVIFIRKNKPHKQEEKIEEEMKEAKNNSKDGYVLSFD